MTLTKMLSAVTLATGANGIRATAASTATCTVTAGTYYITDDESATDLLKAITTALAAGAGGTWEARIVSGVVGLRCTTHAWSIDWSHAGSTIDESILGCTATSLSGDANAWDDADVQHKHGWYSTQFIESDSFPVAVADVTQSVSPSRNPHTVLHGDAGTMRDISFAFEPIHKARPTSGYTNQDFKAFHSTCLAGEGVRYYPDVSTTTAYAAYTNVNGYYAGVLDVANCRELEPAKFAPGVDLFAWRLRILGT